MTVGIYLLYKPQNQTEEMKSSISSYLESNYEFSESLKDLFIPAYEYNSHTPYFFSQINDYASQDLQNISVTEAV